MGLTLLIDFVKNKSKWNELGFNLPDFISKPTLSQFPEHKNKRDLYNIYGAYQLKVEPYLDYFTGDSIKDYLKYQLFTRTKHGLNADEVNTFINSLSEEVLGQFKYRRNNKAGTLNLYCLKSPEAIVSDYSSEQLLKQLGFPVHYRFDSSDQMLIN
jgi:hypothetical protein